jgi:signal transduction histidine kinase
MTQKIRDDGSMIPERELTDENLRVEREKADDALARAGVDEIADAVLWKARSRADAVLAAARARTDRSVLRSDARTRERIEATRAREDEVLREERADADETVGAERAEHAALLSNERDETDRSLITERARADGAIATRDEFLGVVSHDLRTLLTAIVNSAELIAADAAQGAHRREELLGHAQRVRRSCGRMARLVGDLLDIASIDAGALAVMPEVGDPAQVVIEAVETFQAQAHSNGISLLAELEHPSSPATFDPGRVLQVLTNLLSNAIKFTPKEGSVVVRLERVTDELRFAVRDTGVGISAENRETVFERFGQVTANHRRGLGLGLYISKCIVQGHGGRIWVESEPGKGSTFYFTLPVVPGSPISPGPSPRA